MNNKSIPNDCKKIPVTNDVGVSFNHVLSSDQRDAINAALAIGRPLLIRGEPGIGKSQLAKAAAVQLGRVFIPFVADVHTEPRDLLWSLDTIGRLAEAQIQGAAGTNPSAVALKNFVVPGALWWAMDWESATSAITNDDESLRGQPPSYTVPSDPQNGCVVLIDEIDKADSSVPNGLLEVLGSNRFHPQGLDEAVESKGVKPLVIITTNNERSLPDAFIRRCLALDLTFPKDTSEQREFLKLRASENYSDLDFDTVISPAIEMLIEDRAQAKSKRLSPLPGQAEFFDLLRGVVEIKKQNSDQDIGELMKQLRRFTYQKHQYFPREATR